MNRTFLYKTKDGRRSLVAVFSTGMSREAETASDTFNYVASSPTPPDEYRGAHYHTETEESAKKRTPGTVLDCTHGVSTRRHISYELSYTLVHGRRRYIAYTKHNGKVTAILEDHEDSAAKFKYLLRGFWPNATLTRS